jgi:hypothetical protein
MPNPMGLNMLVYVVVVGSPLAGILYVRALAEDVIIFSVWIHHTLQSISNEKQFRIPYTFYVEFLFLLPCSKLAGLSQLLNEICK